MYLPIYIIRIDEPSAGVFMLAGEETEILVYRDGSWRLLS